MLQVAMQACQIRSREGRIITLERGKVIEYSEGHPHLRPLTEPIDFKTAGEEELLKAEYDLDDLKTFIKETFEVPVRVRSKDKLVEKLIDCRFRQVGIADINRID